MLNAFIPSLAIRIGPPRLHYPKSPPRVVAPNIKKVSVVIRDVSHVLLARMHHLPLGRGFAGGNVANLARGMACGKKQEVSLSARFSPGHIEFFIFFFEGPLFGSARPPRVGGHLVFALRLVIFGASEDWRGFV